MWYVDWWSYLHKVYMPREFTKTTHLQGARRFAKKWGLEPPEED